MFDGLALFPRLLSFAHDAHGGDPADGACGFDSSIPGMPMDVLALLCIHSLGLMGVISRYATGPAPMYYGSGHIDKGDFWKFGLIFGVIFFAGLLIVRAAVAGTDWHETLRRIVRPHQISWSFCKMVHEVPIQSDGITIQIVQ